MEKTKRNKLVRLILPLFILFSLLLTGCEQYNLFGKNDNSASGDESKDTDTNLGNTDVEDGNTDSKTDEETDNNTSNGDENQNPDSEDNNTTEDEKESSVLESGFKPSASDETSPYFAAYKSDKTEFDIDNVTLEFFYGGNYSPEIEFELEHGSNYPWFDIGFKNDEHDRVLIKRVEENFVSEKYRCRVILSENRETYEVKYNHSETITIPKEMFTKETGIIWFLTYGENPRDFEPKYQSLAGTYIHYKIVGDKVFLSNKPFE